MSYEGRISFLFLFRKTGEARNRTLDPLVYKLKPSSLTSLLPRRLWLKVDTLIKGKGGLNSILIKILLWAFGPTSLCFSLKMKYMRNTTFSMFDAESVCFLELCPLLKADLKQFRSS